MQILILADDDSVRHRIGSESADVLLSCGDIYDDIILETAKKVGCSHILAVKGNHDSGAPFPPSIIDLHLKIEIIDGISFGGFQGSWRYKPRGNFLYEQAEVQSQLASFPPVDVFVAHNSPRHIHDREDDVHFGFEAFVSYIERTQPALFIHGHMHIDQTTEIGKAKVLGVYGQKRLQF